MLTKNPINSSSAGSRRPAIGNPIATSELALSLENTTARAACMTMKLVALCSRARPLTRCCNSAGHATSTLEPLWSATKG
ncbi:Uncharacterised protein [Mycobacteroides abscessus subsp. abscessus]|nr:Uncharacterised protein [Mycobacteroides abscessus subsp. abscessus]